MYQLKNATCVLDTDPTPTDNVQNMSIVRMDNLRAFRYVNVFLQSGSNVPTDLTVLSKVAKSRIQCALYCSLDKHCYHMQYDDSHNCHLYHERRELSNSDVSIYTMFNVIILSGIC